VTKTFFVYSKQSSVNRYAACGRPSWLVWCVLMATAHANMIMSVALDQRKHSQSPSPAFHIFMAGPGLRLYQINSV